MDAWNGLKPDFAATAAGHLLRKPKLARNREVRQEKPTAENKGGGTCDRHMKPMANVVPILEAKEGGKGREGALETGDQG
ncbi:hypothetical protein VTK26DRAFT_3608 [Humicola hyalothermophila]